MNRLRLFAAISLSFCCFVFSTRADKVDSFIKAEMEKRKIPGLAITIIRDGKKTKTAAYGFSNLELKTRATTETVFEIGSVTKQITAAGIMLLQQDGKLSVDDNIGKHIPGIPSAWSDVTIRHLLQHTSGIKSYTGLDGFELTEKLTQKRFVEKLAPLPLEFAPGEKWKYSNSGYSLLGYIIENVSGKNYWEFLSERIFAPLGMNTATNRDPRIIVPNRASGYDFRDGKPINRDYDLTDVFSAGAIVGTVGDLAKWNAALDSDKLLTAASKAQMWTPGSLNNGQSHNYGFGFRIDEFQGHRNIGHSGSTSGFSATLQRFPDDKLCVIILCNSEEMNVATTLARTVAALYFDKNVIAR